MEMSTTFVHFQTT